MATSWQVSFLSFIMNIFGAKFKEHCFNISRDILDWVLYCFSGTTYDIITFIICITWKQISRKRKNIFQKGKCYSSWLWKAFQLSSNYFLLHRCFKWTSYKRTKRWSVRFPLKGSFKLVDGIWCFCAAYTKCITAVCYDWFIYLFICVRESSACHVV